LCDWQAAVKRAERSGGRLSVVIEDLADADPTAISDSILAEFTDGTRALSWVNMPLPRLSVLGDEVESILAEFLAR